MRGISTLLALGILAVVAVTSCTGVRAEPLPKTPYSIRIVGLASDGPAVMPTPVVEVVPTAVPAAVPTAVMVETRPHWNPDVERWRWLVAAYFPSWAVDEALDVIQHESRGDPNVWNFEGSGACGLLQLLPCVSTDPEINIAAGFEKWLDGGMDFWRHWRQWW